MSIFMDNGKAMLFCENNLCGLTQQNGGNMQEQVDARIWINSQEISMVNPAITLTAEAGNHTKVTLSGILKEESHQLVNSVSPMAEIQIQAGTEKDYLFWGVVTAIDVRIKMSGGRQYQELSLEAMSATCRLDQKKKCTAFQNRSVSYGDIFGKVLQDYSEAGHIFSEEVRGKEIKRFTVQYEETDWEFLSRTISFLHSPLVADHRTGGIKFTAGVVWKSGTYSIPAEEEWQVEIIHDEHRHLSWQPEDPHAPIFDVGDCIQYQGTGYYVKRTEVVVKDHVLYQTCLLYTKEGFYVAEIENPMLTGLSLPGSVREVKGNQLRITLDIDAFEDTDCWFVYSTFYSTFYCMPEKDDRINLYFPDHLEDHSFVLNSVRAEPRDVVIASSAGSNTASGKPSSGGTTSPGETIQTGDQPVQTIDITPYLAMLASPENGKLINITATMEKESAVNAADVQSQAGGSTGNTGSGAASTAGNAGAVQRNYDFQTMAQNENIKILCTKNGRMVVLDDDAGSVSIVCDDGTYIALEDRGIFIVTEEKITFRASKEICLSAGAELQLSAEKEINIKCKDTEISVTEEKISMEGTDILLNGE